VWVKYRFPFSGKVCNMYLYIYIYIYSNLCAARLMSNAYVIIEKKNLGENAERREKLT